jgi:hypothetical protein
MATARGPRGHDVGAARAGAGKTLLAGRVAHMRGAGELANGIASCPRYGLIPCRSTFWQKFRAFNRLDPRGSRCVAITAKGSGYCGQHGAGLCLLRQAIAHPP